MQRGIIMRQGEPPSAGVEPPQAGVRRTPTPPDFGGCAWPEWVFSTAEVERMSSAIERRPSVEALVAKGVLKSAVADKAQQLERRARS
eukprot:6152317-Prymnesium_polylepis.1